MIKTRKFSIGQLKKEDSIRPELLVGVTIVDGTTVILNEVTLDALTLGTVPVPIVQDDLSMATRIRSIQCNKGLTMISLDGTFTTPVKDVIVAIGNAMMERGITASFLPASTQTDRPGKKVFRVSCDESAQR